jgi:hypothetical protein
MVPGMDFAVFANPFGTVLFLVWQQNSEDSFAQCNALLKLILAVWAAIGLLAEQKTDDACAL